MSRPYYSDDQVTLWHGEALDVLRTLPDGSVDCVVTSPPYYRLRDYGVEGQHGLEATVEEYVDFERAVFAEVRRVLVDEGTLWLNLGDSYSSGHGPTLDVGFNRRSGNAEGARKQEVRRPSASGQLPALNLHGAPWRVALALQADGWILRNAVAWHKSNAKPESVRRRLACRYEFLFFMVKAERYWFDLDAIRVPYLHPENAAGGSSRGHASGGLVPYPGGAQQRHGRNWTANERGKNPGDVWTIPTEGFPGAHFAVMPVDLAEQCVLAGCRPGGTVLDPFSGAGTTGLAATRHGRRFVGVELNEQTLELSLTTRLRQVALMPDPEGVL